MTVKKRSGEIEKFDADKINKVLDWACNGIAGTSFEEVAMNANLSFFDGISSRDIHNTLIEAAAGLISEEKSQYQYVASRLLNYQLRKEVWGGKNAPQFINFVKESIVATFDLIEIEHVRSVLKTDFINPVGVRCIVDL